MSEVAQDERVARAALTYLAEPGDPWLAGLVGECGAVRTVAAIREGRFPADHEQGMLWSAADDAGTGGSGPPGQRPAPRDSAMRAMERWRVRLREIPEADDLARLRDRGIRLLCPSDPQWPEGLASLASAQPHALWLRGTMTDLDGVCRRSVAIVGSRAATAYGSYVAAEIAAFLAARGWTVVSGGAYGVDGCAHRGALAGGGVTIAVMACGVDRYYPAGHTDLLNGIAASGAIVSEWPPGRSAARLRFLVRNRVIAAMTTGTLVVEAGKRSGALNTARHARDLRRPLMAVPGPVTSDLSAGCHLILRDWAGTLVTHADEVIDCLTWDGAAQLGGPTWNQASGDVPAAAVRRDVPGLADRARDALDLEAATVLDTLPMRGGMSTSDIAVRAGLTPSIVLAKLAVLTVFGFAERTDRGWKAKRS